MEFTISLTAERLVVRETLKGIVWTIFFNRLFGPVTPVTNEFMDVAYPLVANLPDLDSLIDTKIDELIKRDFTASPTNTGIGQLVVQFLVPHSTKAKKKSGWFGHLTEDKALSIPWESWIININCLPVGTELVIDDDNKLNPAEKMLQLSLLSFENSLAEVMDLVDRHKDHIPPIVTLDVLPFPYEIKVDPPEVPKPPSADDESWRLYIKKIIDSEIRDH